MQIAQVSLLLPSVTPGGSASQVHALSNALVRRGHVVTVFSIYPAPEGAIYRVKHVSLGRLASLLHERLAGTAMVTFPVSLARESFDGFDVIHAHGDSHFLMTKTPTVRTFHSTGLAQAVHATTIRRRVGMLCIYPLELISGLRADARVFVSASAGRYYPGRHLEVIPNGVDLTLFKPGDKSRNPTILFVAGTGGGYKRLSLLVSAFQLTVLPRFPSAELWVVAKEKITGPGIRWHGLLSAEALAPLYRRAWLLCSPSSHETFGVPYIEAMASGTAVVSTWNDGAAEVLGDGYFGLMAADHLLGEALVSILGSESERHTIESRGLLRAREYDLMRMVDRYEAKYHEVIEHR